MLLKNSPIDIEGIYEKYIDEKQEENRIKRYEGREDWYHASGAGSCSRKLYFESVEKAEVSNPIDRRTKRLLKLGNIVHDDIQNSLTRTHYNRDNNIDNNIALDNKEKETDAIKKTLANKKKALKEIEKEKFKKKNVSVKEASNFLKKYKLHNWIFLFNFDKKNIVMTTI